MENLAETIEKLIEEHGAEAVVSAFKEHHTPTTDDTTPTCPKGYVYNGSVCVLDIG